jgi:hypothetical protein
LRGASATHREGLYRVVVGVDELKKPFEGVSVKSTVDEDVLGGSLVVRSSVMAMPGMSGYSLP